MGRRGRKRQLDVESGTGSCSWPASARSRRADGWDHAQDRLPVAGRARRRPAGPAGRSGPYDRYLSLLERQRIATLRGHGLGVREIARRLDRSPSTVSRELRRNLRPHDRDCLRRRPGARPRPGAGPPAAPGSAASDAELRAGCRPSSNWNGARSRSPRTCAATYPDRPRLARVPRDHLPGAVHGGKGGLSRQLTRRLRTGRPLRKRRRRADQRAVRFVAPALLIDHRPAAVDRAMRVGDWEGDLIVGRMSHSAIGTLVDRTSRYVR